MGRQVVAEIADHLAWGVRGPGSGPFGAVLEVAEQGGWSPAQVALASLIAQPGDIILIVVATKESQLAGSPASVGVRPDPAVVQRLSCGSRGHPDRPR